MAYSGVKIDRKCYNEILEIRKQLVKRGLKILPKDILPEQPEKAFEKKGIMEIAIQLLSKQIKEAT